MEQKYCHNCPICNEPDNAIHIMFTCKINKEIWKSIDKALGIKSKIKEILTVQYDEYVNKIIFKILYLLYKYWIEAVNNRLNRSQQEINKFLRSNLAYEAKINNIMSQEEIVKKIEKILEIL